MRKNKSIGWASLGLPQAIGYASWSGYCGLDHPGASYLYNLSQNQTPGNSSCPGSNAKHAKARRTQRILQNIRHFCLLRVLCVSATQHQGWAVFWDGFW